MNHKLRIKKMIAILLFFISTIVFSISIFKIIKWKIDNNKTGDVLIVGKDKYGNIDYLIAGESDFDGPYTVNEDGKIPLSDKDYSSYSVIKNGSTSTFANIKKNDIVYVSGTLNTVFVYNKKVSGVYLSATPNMDSPQSVTVGGNQYKIESTLAFSKLSQGGYKKGDSIVLLLGRDGGVADVLGNKTEISQSTAQINKEEANTINSAYALLNAIGGVELQNGALLNNTLPATRGEFAKMIAEEAYLAENQDRRTGQGQVKNDENA